MPKLDIEKIKRESIAVFDTKAEMLKYIKKVAFKDDVMQIKYFHKKWALENGYQKGLAIDRINPNDDYKPSNCRFITVSENSKRVIHKKEKRGEN